MNTQIHQTRPENIYRIDVNIVDDHTLLTESLAEAIDRSGVAHVSRTFSTLESCRQTLEKRCPDVLLLDISMPDGSGIVFCRQMLEEHPKMKIVCVTIHDEASVIRRMLASGAHGYLLKSSPVGELIEAIQTVWKGDKYYSRDVNDLLSKTNAGTIFLSNIERDILRLICDGHTNPEIATKINLSTETINWYRKRLLAKFGVKNAVALASLALKEQLL